MKLGQFEMDKPVFLAPMAGVTDKAYREIARSIGAHYVWTEMISDKALTYQNSRTLSMLDLTGEESPRIVQIFGSEPSVMAQAGCLAVEHNADIIDLNMGCPAPKIVKNGEGSALLLNLDLAERIAKAVVKAVTVPVTVKMRLGWGEGECVAPELAKRLEAAGVQMLTVHGRTREQFYAGHADPQGIRRVKEAVQIPVIANGDIFTPQDAENLLAQTGCDGVMIGRGALGNPWLIPRTEHYLWDRVLEAEPSYREKVQVALKHFERILSYKGEHVGLNEMRKHAVWYIKGIRNAAQLRDQIMQTKTPQEMRDILSFILQ
ncbi:tRNA dihydrouridine synthase DusB [Desulfitobacterium sp.]|uniref:tRNA dihydrouridine synthase DusB n=1 Tax=Desulfitobacterium sp. TaxID=49981 RepID=UPI002B22014C|nr:tRNA dihydrouridine synthase DusB [Desulfitobacterium sp.]MEA4902864.1 tRNA dihydrouridine synthase DusB [Desulfitobacterium sp.]